MTSSRHDLASSLSRLPRSAVARPGNLQWRPWPRIGSRRARGRARARPLAPAEHRPVGPRGRAGPPRGDLRPAAARRRASAPSRATCPVSAQLDDLLAAVRPEVTIVCTPIHTHAELALTAAAAGLARAPGEAADAHARGLRRSCARARRAPGRACQVGFQSLGSHALPHVRALIADGAIGRVVGIGAAGAWQRDAAYYARAPWAGRRSARRRAGGRRRPHQPVRPRHRHRAGPRRRRPASGLRDVRVELFRANPIEADDTSCLRLVTGARHPDRPSPSPCAPTARSSRTWWCTAPTAASCCTYRTGRVRLERPASRRCDHRARVHRPAGEPRRPPPRPGGAPARPARGTRGFMQVVEAVRRAPEPVEVPCRAATRRARTRAASCPASPRRSSAPPTIWRRCPSSTCPGPVSAAAAGG